MSGSALVWQFVPDVAQRRRTLMVVRFAVVGLAAAAIFVGWLAGGLLGVLVALASVMLLVLVVESWGRSAPDVGPQRMWLDGDVLRFDGPEIYDRAPGDEAFEGDDREGALATIDLGTVEWISVYPAMTTLIAGGGARDRPRTDFHLVVDARTSDGARRCVVFDRRIPFRIAGERGLADAVAEIAHDRWTPLPPDEPFGELDRLRLHDWGA